MAAVSSDLHAVPVRGRGHPCGRKRRTRTAAVPLSSSPAADVPSSTRERRRVNGISHSTALQLLPTSSPLAENSDNVGVCCACARLHSQNYKCDIATYVRWENCTRLTDEEQKTIIRYDDI